MKTIRFWMVLFIVAIADAYSDGEKTPVVTPSNVGVAVEEVRTHIKEIQDATIVDVKQLEYLESVGTKLADNGLYDLASDCFEAISMFGQSHYAYRFLASEMGIPVAIQATIQPYDRAARMLEMQIEIAPMLLENTPLGVNQDGSILDVMNCCPDVCRGLLMARAEQYEKAIPFLESVLERYDRELGRLRSVTLEQAGISKRVIYGSLILCYGKVLKGEAHHGANTHETRTALYNSILGALEEEEDRNKLSVMIIEHLPLAFDPLGSVDEIRRMGSVFDVVGPKFAELLVTILVYPDESRRLSRCTGEEMEMAYQEYIRLLPVFQDGSVKREYAVNISLGRLRNAIRKLEDRGLADSVVCTLSDMMPLTDRQHEVFSGLQEEYIHKFSDVKLKDLPFSEIVIATSRILPKVNQDVKSASDKSAFVLDEEISGESVDGESQSSSPPIWRALFVFGLILSLLAITFRKRR